MRREVLERALWIATCAVACTGTLATMRLRPEATIAPRASTGRAAFAGISTEPDGDSLVAMIISANPFRLDRRGVEATVVEVAPPVVDTAPPKPSALELMLRGTFGGPVWEALVEGLPGVRGAVVVKAGLTFGPFLIVSVKKDSLVVRSGDQQWTYGVVVPWN